MIRQSIGEARPGARFLEIQAVRAGFAGPPAPLAGSRRPGGERYCGPMGRERRTRRRGGPGAAALAAVLAGQLAACSAPPSGALPDAAPLADAAAPDAGLDPDTAPDDLLFAEDTLHDLDLELDDEAMASLRAEPRAWACGALRFGHRRFPIGLRLKGSASFQTLDRKPALKIRFDGPCGGPHRFFGRTRLTLNNLVQDRTAVREQLGYAVFRLAGVPASRTGYARVTLNGRDYGLYANVETVDRDMLAHHFADPGGPLYEGSLQVDLEAADLDAYELDEGDDPERAELARLIARVEAGDATVLFGPEPLIDLDAFVSFLAASAVTADWDGYWKPNNYRIYFEPTGGRWYFLPWGLDQVWGRMPTAFDGAGALIQLCQASRPCLERYRDEVERVLALAEADTAERMPRMVALIEEAAADDPRLPYPEEEVMWARRALPVHMAATFDGLREQFGCLGGEGEGEGEATELDRDGDGARACAEDCDDGDPARGPDAPELCNGIDDDCNGLVDDAPGCACQELAPGAARLVLCPAARAWPDARAMCQELGGDLAWLPDAEENFALWTALRRRGGIAWLIGINDLEEEGTYRWADGAAPGFLRWHFREPNNFGDEDCGEIYLPGDSGWNDINCETPRPAVCRLPAAPEGPR